VLDLDLVDEVATVTNEESIEFAHRLHKEEGVTVGISCGAAAAAATRVAARPESQGKLIVAILPDAGDRYHSSILFQEIAVWPRPGRPVCGATRAGPHCGLPQ
jgi:cysteine synthase A